MVAAVSSGAKGLYALGILSHEASIIAAKERTEMKTIEFFIPRKLSLTALDIQSQRAGILKGNRAPGELIVTDTAIVHNVQSVGVVL